jgi:hypothetical protein
MDRIDWKEIDQGQQLDSATSQSLLDMGIDHPSFPWHQRLVHTVKGFFSFSAIRRYVYHDQEAGFRTWSAWWCSSFSWDGAEINQIHGPQAKIHDLLVVYLVTGSSVI